MGEQLLLRFRDLISPTIEEHNKIANNLGYVFWGWWKKPAEPLPEPGLPVLSRRDSAELKEVFLIDSGTRKLYSAPLKKIVYLPGGESQKCPQLEACPDYYRNMTLPAWFQLGLITEISRDVLSQFVWSSNNASGSESGRLPHAAIGTPVTDTDFLAREMTLWFLVRLDDRDYRERAMRVAPFSRSAWPTSGHYILHISDLHFGEQHGFRNHLAKGIDTRLGEESMLEALWDDLDALHLTNGKIAMIAVTGDLSWSGEAHEFENAARMLQDLCSRLRLHPSQVVVVPGNHDIEWRDEHGTIDENSELNYGNFCERFYGAPSNEDFSRIHRFVSNNKQVTCIALNSCRIERRANAGLGFVGRKQLALIARELQGPAQPDETRIALVHHHLVSVNYVEEIDWDTKKVSLMLDAESVLRCLLSLGVKVVCHGHQHQPFVAVERRIVTGHVDPVSRNEKVLDGQIIVIGGGSLGVGRKHLNQIGRNAYNLIDISGGPARFELITRVRSPSGPGFVDYSQRLVI